MDRANEILAPKQAEPLELAYPDIGMVVGSLLAHHCCKIRLHDPEQSSLVKRAVVSLMNSFGLSEPPFYLKSTQEPDEAAETRTIRELSNYVTAHGERGTVIVDKVDYTGQTATGRPRVAAYLAELLNAPTTPRMLVLGFGAFSRRSAELDMAPAAQDFLAGIKQAFILSERGFEFEGSTSTYRITQTAPPVHADEPFSVPRGYVRLG